MLRFLLIIVFAAALVALGGKELHRKYIQPAEAGGRVKPQILRDLQGETPIERAQFKLSRYEALERERRRRLDLEQLDAADSLDLEQLIGGLSTDEDE